MAEEGKKEESNEPVFIDMLDDHCLAEIFSYLTTGDRIRIERVCSRWQAVAKENWHDVKTLNLICTEMKKVSWRQKMNYHRGAKQMLIRSGKFLRHLIISSDFHSKILQFVHDNCRDLITLELQLRKYSKNHFLGAFSNMKNLQSLTIKSDGGRISLFDCLQSVPEDIDEISLEAKEFYDEFSGPSNYHVLAKFSHLRTLTLREHFFSSNAIVEAIIQNRELLDLDLRGCRYNKNLSLMPFSQFAKLEYLNLFFAYDGVDDKFLISLTRNSRNLTFLDISGCSLVSECGINELVKLQNLKVLNIGAIDFDADAEIKIWPFPMLEHIDCRYLCVVNDTFVQSVLENNPKINYFNVCWTPVTIEILKFADNLMKRQDYDRELCIRVDEHIKWQFNESKDWSPYLHVMTD